MTCDSMEQAELVKSVLDEGADVISSGMETEEARPIMKKARSDAVTVLEDFTKTKVSSEAKTVSVIAAVASPNETAMRKSLEEAVAAPESRSLMPSTAAREISALPHPTRELTEEDSTTSRALSSTEKPRSKRRRRNKRKKIEANMSSESRLSMPSAAAREISALPHPIRELREKNSTTSRALPSTEKLRSKRRRRNKQKKIEVKMSSELRSSMPSSAAREISALPHPIRELREEDSMTSRALPSTEKSRAKRRQRSKRKKIEAKLSSDLHIMLPEKNKLVANAPQPPCVAGRQDPAIVNTATTEADAIEWEDGFGGCPHTHATKSPEDGLRDAGLDLSTGHAQEKARPVNLSIVSPEEILMPDSPGDTVAALKGKSSRSATASTRTTRSISKKRKQPISELRTVSPMKRSRTLLEGNVRQKGGASNQHYPLQTSLPLMKEVSEVAGSSPRKSPESDMNDAISASLKARPTEEATPLPDRHLTVHDALRACQAVLHPFKNDVLIKAGPEATLSLRESELQQFMINSVTTGTIVDRETVLSPGFVYIYGGPGTGKVSG